MKLIIQIPCFNEAQTLPVVLDEIPKQIIGVDEIKKQVIDDGSTDSTLQVARDYNVDYIIENIRNKGLGNSFRIGMEHAFYQGADILVNTDGDNQYPSKFIADLIQPIIRGEADIVIGNRQTSKIRHFSLTKKVFQWLGTKTTLFITGEKDITDAASGFRAYSRNAMLKLNITSDFSYILDSTVQAAQKRLKIVSIDITTNAPTRSSRLFTSMFEHIRKSAMDLVRVYTMYQPMRVFFWLGIFTFILGCIPMGRFLWDYFFGDHGQGMIQSLIFGAIFLIVSSNLFALGIIGDLMAKNRTLIERMLREQKIKKFENDK